MAAVFVILTVLSVLGVSWMLADEVSAPEPILLVVWGALLLVVSSMVRHRAKRQEIPSPQPPAQEDTEVAERADAVPAR